MTVGCEMHGRPDCEDCFLDAAAGCWEVRDLHGRPVRVRPRPDVGLEVEFPGGVLALGVAGAQDRKSVV